MMALVKFSSPIILLCQVLVTFNNVIWSQLLKIYIFVELGVGKVALSRVRAVNCRLLCNGKVVDFCNLTKCFVNYAKMLRYFPEDRLKLKYISSSQKIACFIGKKIKTLYL